jgi:hypothetical protein
MKKRLKAILLLILVLVIWVVLYLSFGWWRRNDNIEVPSTPDVDLDVVEPTEPIKLEEEEWNFEEDVMKDLEWFFNNTNWYENIEGEYWFTDAELE